MKRVRTMGAVIVAAMVIAALFVPAAASAIPAPTVAVYRFYNQGTGTHFYTSSVQERDYVIATWPNVFTYEGPAFYVYGEEIVAPDNVSPQGFLLPPTTPVHRFYNLQNGSHFYTISAQEADLVKAKYPSVFRYEGIAFNAYTSTEDYVPLLPVYRFYNVKNGSHFYTISEEEKSLVQLYYGDTYRFEGVAFYALTMRVFS